MAMQDAVQTQNPEVYVLNREFVYGGEHFPPGTRVAECVAKSDARNICFVINGLEITAERGGRVHTTIQDRAS